MTEAPKVEQVDREAAFNLFQAVNGGNNPLLRNNYLSGFFDNTNEVIAFARHRELATLTEPERTAKAVAEAVERVARKICAADNRDPDAIHPPGLGQPQWTHSVRAARAAIAALTPPAAEGEEGDIEIANRAVEANLLPDGTPAWGTANAYACARDAAKMSRLALSAPKVAGVEMVEGVPVRKLLDSMTADYVRMMRTTLAAIETGRNEPLMVVRDQILNVLAAAPSAPDSGEGEERFG